MMDFSTICDQMYACFDCIDYDNDSASIYSCCTRYNDDYYPDLGDLTIDDILTQDDPPKDLYLKDDECIEIDIEDEDEQEVLYLLYAEEYSTDSDFDIYEHFGIPSDIPDFEREGMLEAARNLF